MRSVILLALFCLLGCSSSFTEKLDEIQTKEPSYHWKAAIHYPASTNSLGKFENRLHELEKEYPGLLPYAFGLYAASNQSLETFLEKIKEAENSREKRDRYFPYHYATSPYSLDEFRKRLRTDLSDKNIKVRLNSGDDKAYFAASQHDVPTFLTRYKEIQEAFPKSEIMWGLYAYSNNSLR
ncbi:hypothetical protein DSCO28_38780 [Desulfosarcina ovata subsp. sediminis]|uniref:Lipoprotein n=1 Tax=Desulfosarcina ovata subsp. sediminis TaxID=885957 RepID=A0A5K7ZSY7_9BACT|nr:hypothetical protein [Desulfosarcina ovata]BBO83312.1 hypothetical protein DSCO28_38780 [Desulfosarcina ovata subsp. sediminis]